MIRNNFLMFTLFMTAFLTACQDRNQSVAEPASSDHTSTPAPSSIQSVTDQ